MEEIPPHLPVLLEESISQLLTDLNGIYLDSTIGFGGHAFAIMEKLTPAGKLIGLDLDPYALEYCQKRLSGIQGSYSLYNKNFREFPSLLQKLGINKLTGILFDLGSSSSQIDTGHRGFSFRQNAPLDMRFNPNTGMSAYEYLNHTNINELSAVINEYGEERYHKKIAHQISKAAKNGRMSTTFDLKNAVQNVVGKRFLDKSLARVFQAFRIKVNDELNSFRIALENSIKWVNQGGRIAIISFHSLEDRIVKQFFINNAKTCICPREYPVCICNKIPTLKILTKKAIIPSAKEQQKNPRSKSAKLRIAERI